MIDSIFCAERWWLLMNNGHRNLLSTSSTIIYLFIYLFIHRFIYLKANKSEEGMTEDNAVGVTNKNLAINDFPQ